MEINGRQQQLSSIRLSPGSHDSMAEGACAMELVAWLAGEKWSDNPQNACPVLGVFIRAWNDVLPDNARESVLLPVVPKLVRTRAGPNVELRRAFMAADWLLRVNAPSWLRLAGLHAEATLLESLSEIMSPVDVSTLPWHLNLVDRPVRAACATAWKNEWYTGRDAPRDAEWFDAWESTLAGPYATCQVFIQNPVWEAVRDLAQCAAGAAFWGQTRDSIYLPVAELTQSTLALVERMITTRSA